MDWKSDYISIDGNDKIPLTSKEKSRPLDYKLVFIIVSIWLHNGYINVSVYTKIPATKSQSSSPFQSKALSEWRPIIIKNQVKITLDISLYFLSCFIFGWKIRVLLM